MEGAESALTKRSTVRELVATFEQTERDVRAAFALIVAAETRVNAAFTLGDYHRICVRSSRHSHNNDFADADAAVEHMARRAWQCIVERLELRKTMSIKRYEELEKLLERGELPPITEENVQAFVAEHAADMRTNFEEAVREVFDWLRPREADGWKCKQYKTARKSLFEVDRNVVLTGMVSTGYGRSRFRVEYRDAQKLVALENVLLMLDGRGCIQGHVSALQGAIEAVGADGSGETDLFKFRCYKNRSLHMTFKRLDLLKKFNEVAGGATMRPGHRELETT